MRKHGVRTMIVAPLFGISLLRSATTHHYSIDHCVLRLVTHDKPCRFVALRRLLFLGKRSQSSADDNDDGRFGFCANLLA